MTALPRRVIAALAILPAAGLAVFYVWPLLTLLSRAIDGGALRTTLERPAR